MAVNPFGDSSDSVHAWRERYRQLEQETNSLRQTVGQARSELLEIKSLNESVLQAAEAHQEENSNLKQELLAFKEIVNERSTQVKDLEHKLDVNQIEKLQSDNVLLKEKVEDLGMQVARGGESNPNTDNSLTQDSQKIFTTIIPVILNEYDGGNAKYKDAFKNLIEVAISDGDILTQVIAILYKYGGSGPIDRVRSLVKDKNSYETAIDLLIEEKLITRVDRELHLYSMTEDLSLSSNWTSMTSSELIDLLIQVIEKGSMSAIEKSVDNFRDELTERGTSTSTIFFQIRKLKEGLLNKSISRPEAMKTLEEWRVKI